MSWFGDSQRRLRQPGNPMNLTPSPGAGDTVNAVTPPPSTAQSTSLATVDAIAAARKQRKRAAAKPGLVGTAAGQTGHPVPAGSFLGKSLLGY